jgi:hypothetical protein
MQWAESSLDERQRGIALVFMTQSPDSERPVMREAIVRNDRQNMEQDDVSRDALVHLFASLRHCIIPVLPGPRAHSRQEHIVDTKTCTSLDAFTNFAISDAADTTLGACMHALARGTTSVTVREEYVKNPFLRRNILAASFVSEILRKCVNPQTKTDFLPRWLSRGANAGGKTWLATILRTVGAMTTEKVEAQAVARDVHDQLAGGEKYAFPCDSWVRMVFDNFGFRWGIGFKQTVTVCWLETTGEELLQHHLDMETDGKVGFLRQSEWEPPARPEELTPQHFAPAQEAYDNLRRMKGNILEVGLAVFRLVTEVGMEGVTGESAIAVPKRFLETNDVTQVPGGTILSVTHAQTDRPVYADLAKRQTVSALLRRCALVTRDALERPPSDAGVRAGELGLVHAVMSKIGARTSCDGQPSLKAVGLARDMDGDEQDDVDGSIPDRGQSSRAMDDDTGVHVENDAGTFHFLINLLQCLHILLFDAVLHPVIMPHRPHQKQQKFFKKPADPTTIVDELRAITTALIVHVARVVARVHGTAAQAVSIEQLYGHMHERARQCPLAYCVLLWFDLSVVMTTLIETEQDSLDGFDTFIGLLPIMQLLFSVTNKYEYAQLCCHMMERWRVKASRGEWELYRRFGFALPTPTGRHAWVDRWIEWVNGSIRAVFGKRWMRGAHAEDVYSRTVFNLQDLLESRRCASELAKDGGLDARVRRRHDNIEMHPCFSTALTRFEAMNVFGELGSPIFTHDVNNEKAARQEQNFRAMIDGFGRALNPTFIDVLTQAQQNTEEVCWAHIGGRKMKPGTTALVPSQASQSLAVELDSWMRKYSTDVSEIQTGKDRHNQDLFSETAVRQGLREMWHLGAPALAERTLTSLYAEEWPEKCRLLAASRAWAQFHELIVPERARPQVPQTRGRGKKRKQVAGESEIDITAGWEAFISGSTRRLAHPLHGSPI